MFDEFVQRWPRLQDWFAAPLRERLHDRDGCVRGQHPHGGASVVMPYLSYLSLVHGVGLDYELLLARTFASPFTDSVHQGGLGVDVELFGRHVTRLTQLGYSPTGARHQLIWPLGRMLLHRGDPDLERADDRRSRRAPRRGRCVHRTAALGAAAGVLRPTP